MSPLINWFFNLTLVITCGFIMIFLGLLACAAIILLQNYHTFIKRNHLPLSPRRLTKESHHD